MNFESFTSPYLSLKVNDSILIGTYKENLEIDLHVAKDMVSYRLAFIRGVCYPTLADVRRVKSATREARDYFANEGMEGITALAILVTNFMAAMLANLFINFSRPALPTRVFSNQEEALGWLRGFVAK